MMKNTVYDLRLGPNGTAADAAPSHRHDCRAYRSIGLADPDPTRDLGQYCCQMMKNAAVCALIFAGLLFSEVHASVTLDFENLSAATVIGSNYAADGVIFDGAVIATAGDNLNEAEFPPHSGTNVAFDATGPITLSFTTPVTSFSGYFTYSQPVTLTAYDLSNQVLATVASLLSSNYVSSGNAPNELIQLNVASGIDHLTITGDPAGTSLTLDDVTFSTGSITSVPEPGTHYLMVFGLSCLISSIRLSAPISHQTLRLFRLKSHLVKYNRWITWLLSHNL